MKTLKLIWTKLNGHKIQIGMILTLVVSALSRRGVEIPPWVFDVADIVLGGGLVHRGVKTVGPKIAKVSAGLLAFVLASCTTAAPSAPQPAVAPVNQAGSPVTVNVNVRSNDVKATENDKQDASGAVSTKGGTQEADATTDVKPETNATVPVK